MDRRRILALIATSPLWCSAARAQSGLARVGMLWSSGIGPTTDELDKRVRSGLAAEGWVDGQNVVLDTFHGNNDRALLDTMAAKMVEASYDVLIGSSTPATAALQSKTSSVPIVFCSVSDPVASGFIDAFNRPGRNITGMRNLAVSLGGKWLEFLMRVAPQVTRAALMFNPSAKSGLLYWDSFAEAAERLRIEPLQAPVENAADVNSAVSGLARSPAGGLVVSSDSYVYTNRRLMVDAAARHHVPAVYSWPEFALEGGLLAYGVDNPSLYEKAGVYAGRILNGANPSELPVQSPSVFTLVVNLSTASSQGVIIPDDVLALADTILK